MNAPAIRLDLLRPRLKLVPGVRKRHAPEVASSGGAKDAGNVVAKSSKTPKKHNEVAESTSGLVCEDRIAELREKMGAPLRDAMDRSFARLNAPDVKFDRDRLDWMQLHLNAWSKEARSETTRLGFKLASEAVLLAYNALMCDKPIAAGDANLSTECRAILDGTIKRLDELRCETTKAATIQWIINVLNVARESVEAGIDIERVAAEVENSARRRTSPIPARAHDWSAAIKAWRGGKIEGAGNPGTRTTYKPHEVVCRLLEDPEGQTLSKSDVNKKANALRTKYRGLFA